MNDLGICILAGGEATRLPRKLERTVGSKPLLARVYENLKGPYPVYISAKSTFSPALDAVLGCPLIIDRWARRGPLAGILTVFSEVMHERMFVCAADAPFVDIAAVQTLAQSWQPEDQAVAAEPLLAIYQREAFLNEGLAVLLRGSGAVKDVTRKLRMRTVGLPARTSINMNTEADFKNIRKYEVAT
ncbi:MAG: molybdenum cofactor guanylyltransferase [Candidatus Eremiobacteraeota bacterium]|nr:molybdenum cofactor guanylyltransferase [Candidatus Eremiobacteraeota bacterium]